MTELHDAPSAACNVGVGEKEPQTEDITAFLTIKRCSRTARLEKEHAFKGRKYF